MIDKLCKDCANFKENVYLNGGGHEDQCSVKYCSPIDGKECGIRACHIARHSECYCGASAKHFEEKVEYEYLDKILARWEKEHVMHDKVYFNYGLSHV